ncbi:hypothetical protein EIP86_010569 [Pleurotus ostreatoroseus]|nr:hypothetical protein EIP86_010569 [Pleurotus ostreatoroseus]
MNIPRTDDLELMLERARAAGVRSLIITGGSLHESKEALSLARQHGLYATVGCHPTRSKEFEECAGGPEAYLKELDELIGASREGKGRVVAVGECGLGGRFYLSLEGDGHYDRTHFAPPDIQQKHFRRCHYHDQNLHKANVFFAYIGSQLSLAKKHHLPLFLHSRAAHTDFVKILREEGFGENGGRDAGAKGGVVHSFTGTVQEAEELVRRSFWEHYPETKTKSIRCLQMDMGFHIGLNGCSLKTPENLVTAAAVRLDKLMLETDAPWCSLTSTHASRAHINTLPPNLSSLYFPQATKPEAFVPGKPVKGRNEPTAIGGVAWVLHKLHSDSGLSFEGLTEHAWRNTVDIFGLDELV